MQEMIIQIIASCLGALAAAALYCNRKKIIVAAAMGGLFIWVLYLGLEHLSLPIFLVFMACSAFAALYSEIMARILKAPATCFFLPTVFPMIPGSHLFYAMYYLVQGQYIDSASEGKLTMICVLAMACGICSVWAIFMMIDKFFDTYRDKKRGKEA